MSDSPPIVVGVSGASGAPIAVRVLQALRSAEVPVALVISDGATALLREECDLSPSDLAGYATVTYSDHELGAPIASGSRSTRGMVVVPCSAHTVAQIAVGLSGTLITRAAHVHLKERRRLVIVPRESPLPTTMLRNLTTLSELGVVVLDAAPPYYLRPRSVDDLTGFLAGKVLDHLGVPHQLYRGWKAGEP
ncbi:MAG TPA: UbiX family flavin prenyltransferase [Thermoplasmata archaeon]|nr:UbiX family flavin prenyltransferase [Thermoplasmata archaeon]